MLVDSLKCIFKKNHTILKLNLFITIFLFLVFHTSFLYTKDLKDLSNIQCTKFIGDWQCGEKQVVEKIREVDEKNYTVEFDFSMTRFVTSSNSNSEVIPCLCKNGKLTVDIHSTVTREILQSLSNNVERKKFMNNPGTYLFDKNNRMFYQTYDILDKKNISSKCTRSISE